MKTIMIVSQKGGVGKSTIAEELAYSLDRTGTPYSYYDWDGQGGSHHETREVDGAAVRIVDTPAGLDDDTRANLHEADLVIVATKPTPRDVSPLERTLAIVEQAASCPLLVVVTHYDPRYRLSKEFREYMAGRVGAGNVMTLPLTEMYPQSDMEEKSVVEYARRHKAAEATLALADRVRSLVGLPPERERKELMRLKPAVPVETMIYKELADNSGRRA